MQAQLRTFQTSSRTKMSGQLHAPADFTPEKRVPRAYWPHSWFGRGGEKNKPMFSRNRTQILVAEVHLRTTRIGSFGSSRLPQRQFLARFPIGDPLLSFYFWGGGFPIFIDSSPLPSFFSSVSFIPKIVFNLPLPRLQADVQCELVLILRLSSPSF